MGMDGMHIEHSGAFPSLALTQELSNAIEKLDAPHKLWAESEVVGVKEEHCTGGRWR